MYSPAAKRFLTLFKNVGYETPITKKLAYETSGTPWARQHIMWILKYATVKFDT